MLQRLLNHLLRIAFVNAGVLNWLSSKDSLHNQALNFKQISQVIAAPSAKKSSHVLEDFWPSLHVFKVLTRTLLTIQKAHFPTEMQRNFTREKQMFYFPEKYLRCIRKKERKNNTKTLVAENVNSKI